MVDWRLPIDGLTDCRLGSSCATVAPATGIPTSARRPLRIAAWGAWQLFALFLAFIVYANLFSEYGAFSHQAVDPVAAVVFLAAALYV